MDTQRFLVTWAIDIWDEDPWCAAVQARELLLDPESTAVVFEVQSFADGRTFYDEVDLGEMAEDGSFQAVADSWMNRKED